MNSRWFWSNWIREYKWSWLLIMGIAAFSVVFLWFNYFQGASGIIHWEKLQEQKVVESTVHSFTAGPFELSIPAENYVIVEYFNGSQVSLNIFSSVAFISLLILSAVVLLTIITTLGKYWYFLGMGLFILFVVSLRIEVLALFNQRNQIPTIAFLLVFGCTSYYFQSFGTNVSFRNRLLIFLLLSVLSAVVINFSASVNHPFLYLSVTGYTAGMILSVLFIFIVAHEIPASFVYIASQSTSKSFRHYALISLIYIVYVILTCLHEMGVIHWNLIYINAYFLLSVSAILGLWGFRSREVLYGNIFSFAPLGAFFYGALATIAFITISQLLGSSNDPALKIIRDAILFSHVGYSVIFMTYVFSNFILMMAQNIPSYKVLYKPNRMPYFTFRLAGFIMTLGFVFYSNWREYVYKGIAGFYNNIGDLYELVDLPTVREAYYEQARNYGFENNHANYELAILRIQNHDFEKAHHNYALANGTWPTDYSLVNEGNIYAWESNVFSAIKTYKKGLKLMPESGELLNNIGSAFTRVHQIDSSVFFLNQARSHSNSKASAETNFFALSALEHIPVKADSVLKVFENPSASTLANALVLATSLGLEFKTEINVLKYKQLDINSATLLNNYIIKNAKSLDSTTNNAIYKIASDSLNVYYSEALKASLAHSYYHNGNISKALSILAELVYISQSYKGKFNYIMGLWALEQNNPELASSYFDYAVESDYKDGKFYKAIALTEAQEISEALIAWDTVRQRKNIEEQTIATSMIRILKASVKDVVSMSDQEKYQFCRYKLNVSDTVDFNAIVKTFSSDDYKAQALLDMVNRQYKQDNLISAIRYFNRIGGLKLSDKRLYEDVQHTELIMLAKRRELRAMSQQLNKNVTFGEGRQLEKLYYTALINEASGDSVKAAANYEVLGKYNPYFEDAVIAAADYFRSHGKDKMKAYNILVESIQVNTNSVKLLRAYAVEATRLGFTDYAGTAMQTVEVLDAKLRKR